MSGGGGGEALNEAGDPRPYRSAAGTRPRLHLPPQKAACALSEMYRQGSGSRQAPPSAGAPNS